MEFIAIVVLIGIGVWTEIQIYKRCILPYIVYDCHFSKEEVMEGDQFEIIERVTNPSGLLVPFLKSEITTSNHLEFASNASTVNDKTRSLASLFSIHANQKVTRVWKVSALQRGVFNIEDTTIIGADLFGTYHYSNVIRIKSEVIVLPRPIDMDAYIDRVDESQGERIVRRFILEDPFVTAGVREYTLRDSMNKVHWGITARQGQLMVRNNEATSKQSLTIILNNQLYREQLREPIKDQRLEYAIRIAAGELDKTIKSSMPVRLLANGTIGRGNESLITTEMWGKFHVHELMILLSRLEETYTEHFDKFLAHYGTSILSTEVILITCYIEEAMISFVREKRQLGIHVKIYVLSYEADSKHYDDIQIYYLLDYLKEVGERI